MNGKLPWELDNMINERWPWEREHLAPHESKSPEYCGSPERTSKASKGFCKSFEEEGNASESHKWELQWRRISPTEYEGTVLFPAGLCILRKSSSEAMADMKESIDGLRSRFNVVIKPGFHDDAGMKSVSIIGLQSNIALVQPELIRLLQLHAQKMPHTGYATPATSASDHEKDKEQNYRNWELLYRQVSSTVYEATLHIPEGCSVSWKLSAETMADLKKGIDWVGSRFNVVVQPDVSMQSVVVTGLQSNIELAGPELIKILQSYGENLWPAEGDTKTCLSTFAAKSRDCPPEGPGHRDWELLSRQVGPTEHEATISIPAGRSIDLKSSAESVADFRKGVDWVGSRFNVEVKPGLHDDVGIQSVVVKGMPSNIELARPELIQILEHFATFNFCPKASGHPGQKRGNSDASTEAWRGHLQERQEVIQTALAMNAQGINQGTSGNVSVRVPGGFLITPSGIPYEGMKPEQVVYMDDGGGYYGDFLPSSEWRMHKDVYTNTPAAMAVVHTHSTFATALACNRRPIPAFHYMVGAAGGKCIPCAEYGTFGTQELSDSILKAMRDAGTRGCLMANHGVICHAANLKKALGLAVEIESLAKQYNHACTYGPPIILDDAEMDIILAKFKTYGKQMSEIKCMGCFDQTHAVIPPPRRDKP